MSKKAKEVMKVTLTPMHLECLECIVFFFIFFFFVFFQSETSMIIFEQLLLEMR